MIATCDADYKTVAWHRHPFGQVIGGRFDAARGLRNLVHQPKTIACFQGGNMRLYRPTIQTHAAALLLWNNGVV